MNVLIIGGTRFVGYLLTWRLIAGGHRVTLFNRGSSPDPFGDRVEHLRGDRTTDDFPCLLTGRDFDAVVDLAAYTGEDARRAGEVLQGRCGHYVFISTGQVYLVREGSVPPYGEEDYTGAVIPEPEDPGLQAGWRYGVDKRAAEDALIEAWEQHRFPSTRLRIPMVNGERDYFRRIESYLWRILDGGPILLPDSGTRPCRHVYGGEAVRAIAELLGRSDTHGQAYNLCQDEQPPLHELVGILARMLGARPELVPVDESTLAEHGLQGRDISPFSGKWMSLLDPSKAKAQLGFQHEPLESYLGKIVASFLAHPPEAPPEDYIYRPLELRIASRNP